MLMKFPLLILVNILLKFNDGDEAELAANVIATNMYAQCYPEVNQYVLLDSLIDLRRSTTALCYDDQKVTDNGRTHYRCSTAVWQMCCRGKTDQPPGASYQTSRNLIPLRLLNNMLPKDYTVSLPLIGGFRM